MPSLEEMIAGLQCPICGHVNTYEIKDVEETFKVSSDTVTVTVRAGVCHICGERAYDAITSSKVEAAVDTLRSGILTQLQREGEAYRYA